MANVFKQYEEKRVSEQGRIMETLTAKEPVQTTPAEPVQKTKTKTSSRSSSKTTAKPAKKTTAKNKQENTEFCTMCIALTKDRHVKLKMYALTHDTSVSQLIRDWVDTLD